MAEEKCEICKKNEAAGVAMIAVLRTSKHHNHVVKGPVLCDGCITRMGVLYDLLKSAGGDIAFTGLTRPIPPVGKA
jgi:hypothetical protein